MALIHFEEISWKNINKTRALLHHFALGLLVLWIYIIYQHYMGILTVPYWQTTSRCRCFTFPLSHPEQKSIPPTPDPLVDISEMYSMMVRRQDIEEGYFITCQSHKATIHKQIVLFKELASDERFWVCFFSYFFDYYFCFIPPFLRTFSNTILQIFVSDKRRKARMALHLKIENFIKWGKLPYRPISFLKVSNNIFRRSSKISRSNVVSNDWYPS